MNRVQQIYSAIGVYAIGYAIYITVLIALQFSSLYESAMNWAEGDFIKTLPFIALLLMTPIAALGVAWCVLKAKYSFWLFPILVFIVFMIPSYATYVLCAFFIVWWILGRTYKGT